MRAFAQMEEDDNVYLMVDENEIVNLKTSMGYVYDSDTQTYSQELPVDSILARGYWGPVRTLPPLHNDPVHIPESEV